jgi:hypothetical protein
MGLINPIRRLNAVSPWAASATILKGLRVDDLEFVTFIKHPCVSGALLRVSSLLPETAGADIE